MKKGCMSRLAGQAAASNGVMQHTCRSYVPSEKIDVVLVSETVIGEEAPSKITRVPSKQMTINFCYKDEQENPQTINGIGPIYVPDYQQALLDLSKQKKPSLSESPIYTHMTRL